jgi:Ca2+-binding EF-hand superfamily protein
MAAESQQKPRPRVQQRLDAQFKKLDANKDGSISRDEWKGRPKAFDRLDANHDGKLDEADRGARQKARFDRVDANHDGQVSYAEFSAKHAQRDGARKERMARRGERRADGIGHRGGHRFAMPDFARRAGMIRLADADKDGTITKAEFQAARLQRFDRLDADHDGTVTGDEVKAARDNMRQRWQSRRDDRAS